MLEVHVNFPNAVEAAAVARRAVEMRLAACANVGGSIHSFYWWDEAVQSEDEIPVVLKTSEKCLDALMSFVAREHSHDVPGIVVHRPEGAHASYSAWVERETRRGTP